MVVLSSPSGVGKTTITKKIQQKYNRFKISVSHTTRKPRPNEVNGVDYHFVSEKEFQDLISDNKFYEYAKIYNHYYGTSKDSVENLIKKNDIIFDIDEKHWQDYDYILINENLEKCYNQVEKIIQLNKIKLEQSNKL